MISHFLEEAGLPNAFYWMATTHSVAYQLRDFSQTSLRYDPRFAQPPTEDFTFPSWEAALQHTAEMVEQVGGTHLLVLDEFTYLIRNDPSHHQCFPKAMGSPPIKGSRVKKRSQRMPQVAEGWQTHYALFAREGFTPALQAEAARTGVLLVAAADLEHTLALALA